ncbi:UNVERIFIED_CONTAM: hypothetical protein FKN15_000843 [Acipenser sinensis]
MIMTYCEHSPVNLKNNRLALANDRMSRFHTLEKRLETCALRLFDDVGQGPTSDRKGKIVMSDLV